LTLQQEFDQSKLQSHLWNSANFLRNKIDAGDYKGYIFPLMFYKRISDVYDEEYQSALEESNNDQDFAKSEINHRFQIPDGCHWNDVRKRTKNIGQYLQKSLRNIEKANPETLFGIFGDVNWGNKDRLSDETLLNLIEHFSSLNLSPKIISDDIMGNAYEFLIKKFADDSGHTAAEFYTNRTVVTLMTTLLSPNPKESVYDPTCGTGGMLLECVNHLKRQSKDFRTLKLFGQEKNVITSGIARMNMLLHGYEDAKIRRGDTLSNPLFVVGDELQKFDVILANPPYSINNWNQKSWKNDPFGRNLYGTPPQKKADFAFIQHIVKSMSKTGRAAILLPHGILASDSESSIRKKIIEDDKLESIIGLAKDLFYNSSMRSCIMIFNNNKEIKRKEKVLFIDAESEFKRNGIKNYLSETNIDKIFTTFNSFKSIPEFSYVATSKEILENNALLNISLYIQNNLIDKLSIKEITSDWLHQLETTNKNISWIKQTVNGDINEN